MSGERHRLDVWVFNARLMRTRTIAADFVRAGHVRINGTRVSAPGQAVRLDDVLTISLNSGVRILRVVGFIERRGDAEAARTTYLDITSGEASGITPDSHVP